MNNFLIGILIGSAAILPGISCGVILCCFGMYEKIVNSVVHYFEDIKNNTKFLLPIILGAILGIFSIGLLLKYLFSNFLIPTSYAFIGLILGSIKLIIKQTNVTKFKFSYIACFLAAFLISIFLVYLEKSGKITNFNYDINNFYLIISGFLMSAGIVIPGLSKTVILMLLGIYDLYLSSIATLNFSFLFPLSIGLIFGIIIFLLIFNFLFKHFKIHTYFSIIGFVLGSILVIYPGFIFNLEGLFSILLLILCFYIGIKLSDLKKV